MRPFFALAKELQRKGAQVVLCSHGVYAAESAHYGVPFVAVEPGFSFAEMQAVIASLVDAGAVWKQLSLLMSHLLKNAVARYEAFYNSLLQDCDLLLCHHLDFPAQEAAAAKHIPRMHVFFAPGVLPFAQMSPLSKIPFGWGERGTQILWSVLGTILDSLFQKNTAPLRTHLGRDFLAKPGFAQLSPDGNFLCVSRHLAVLPSAPPPLVTLVPPWILKEQTPSVGQEDDLALKFIEKKGPPFLVNFGSMATQHDTNLFRLLPECAAELQVPLLVQRGWSQNSALIKETEFIHVASSLSHQKIMPLCRAVWHHCGAGTTYAVARAGIPSLPVPHLADQFYWARQLHLRSLAPAPIERAQVTMKRLHQAVNDFEQNPCYHTNAQKMALQLRDENGVALTVTHLEQFLSS